VWEYDAKLDGPGADAVWFLSADAESPDRVVWGPHLQYHAAVTWPAAAAASVAQSFGRGGDQLPRSTWSPADLRFYRYSGRRPPAGTPYRAWTSVLVAATPLEVTGAAAVRSWEKLQLGEVRKLDYATRWEATCKGCPTRFRSSGRRRSTTMLAAHFVARHATVRPLTPVSYSREEGP
jgi:hypothetical protein